MLEISSVQLPCKLRDLHPNSVTSWIPGRSSSSSVVVRHLKQESAHSLPEKFNKTQSVSRSWLRVSAPLLHDCDCLVFQSTAVISWWTVLCCYFYLHICVRQARWHRQWGSLEGEGASKKKTGGTPLAAVVVFSLRPVERVVLPVTQSLWGETLSWRWQPLKNTLTTLFWRRRIQTLSSCTPKYEIRTNIFLVEVAESCD